MLWAKGKGAYVVGQKKGCMRTVHGLHHVGLEELAARHRLDPLLGNGACRIESELNGCSCFNAGFETWFAPQHQHR